MEDETGDKLQGKKAARRGKERGQERVGGRGEEEVVIGKQERAKEGRK